MELIQSDENSFKAYDRSNIRKWELHLTSFKFCLKKKKKKKKERKKEDRGYRRQLRTDGPHDLHCSPNIMGPVKWGDEMDVGT
jgi:hypothetical protein